MASQLSTSVMEQYGSSQRQRCSDISQHLLNLECPYLEGLDESVVKEIILSPGEARLRILQWLITRFHPQLQEALLTTTTTTTTIPRLTSLLADLGMCRREDYELVQGTTSLSKQISFLEALLFLVGESRCDELSDTFSETTIRDPKVVKMDQCCGFLDDLCRQEDLSEVFPSSVSLLSPAIAKSISTNTKIRAPPLPGSSQEGKKRAARTSSVPSLIELHKQVAEMNQLLEAKELELEQLSQQYPSFSQVNQTTLENYHKNLSVSLSTLSQLINSFCHTYESDFQPWTSQQTPPQLSNLGTLCKRIHIHRQYVLKLLESIELLQTSRERIGNLEESKGDLLTVHNISDVQETLQKCLEVHSKSRSM